MYHTYHVHLLERLKNLTRDPVYRETRATLARLSRRGRVLTGGVDAGTASDREHVDERRREDDQEECR